MSPLRKDLGAPGLAPETWVLLPRILLLTTVVLTGCSHYFQATGDLASEGGYIGTWHSIPQGCTRDPFDGLPAPESTSLLTFLWDDPAARDASLRDNHRFYAPNAPLRIEVSRAFAHGTPSYAIMLDTVKTEAPPLNATTCSTLAIDIHEAPKAIPEGRPTLAGSVTLDCRVADSHITADIHFRRCEY